MLRIGDWQWEWVLIEGIRWRLHVRRVGNKYRQPLPVAAYSIGTETLFVWSSLYGELPDGGGLALLHTEHIENPLTVEELEALIPKILVIARQGDIHVPE